MCTVFFMLASLVSPCVLGILGSKVCGTSEFFSN